MRKNIILALGLSATMIATACVEGGDPNTNDRTRQGAITGAIAGAVIGASANGSNDRQQAVRGAVVGAIGGAVIGSVLDAQERKLRQELPSSVGVVRRGNELVVIMSQDLLFATDSANLNYSQQDELRTVARSLIEYPSTTIFVVGHTDNEGSAAYNQDLSERRAATVAAELRAGGVPSNRLSSFGRGESQPIATNQTSAGRAQNRRVEIIIRE
jgi:outer membrane protein OmpA-like peptidoglycan-associated protein